MSRYTGPKAKLCKRVGANIFGSPKYDAILAKEDSKRKTFKKASEYSLQLKEKQLARYMYGVTEKQFKKYFDKAYKSKEVTGIGLLRLLERRMDNAIYRAGLAATRIQARQMVSHGHFELNGHKITVPSAIMKPGDSIVLRKKVHSSPLYVGFDKAESAAWMKLDGKNKTITIERIPEDDEIEKSIKVQLIVEYYSR